MGNLGLKERWMNFVKQQTEKTARDPNTRTKLVGWILVLLIISYNITKAESSAIACGPCVAFASKFCSGLIALGGACVAVAAIPPLLCACFLAAGGVACVVAAGTCVAVCLAPTP